MHSKDVMHPYTITMYRKEFSQKLCYAHKSSWTAASIGDNIYLNFVFRLYFERCKDTSKARNHKRKYKY